MKKAMLTLLLGLGYLACDAQVYNVPHYSSLGPVGGIGFNWLSNVGGDVKPFPSINIGMGYIHARQAHWGWGAQLLFTSEGYTTTYNNDEYTVSTLNFRLPVRGYYFFGNYKSNIRPKVYAGPVLGVVMAQDVNVSNANNDVMMRNTGEYRTLDLGLQVGTGLNIRLANALWFNVDVNYYQGMFDVINDPNKNMNTNQNIGINAGVLFGVR